MLRLKLYINFSIFIIIILFHCYGNRTPLEAIDPFYDIDSSTIMICKINDSAYYGEQYIKTDISYHTGIYLNVFDTTAGVEIQLTRTMYDTSIIPPIPYSDRDKIKYQGITYYLLFSSPYHFSTSVLSDTLIIGKFSGRFINPTINDTIAVQNGEIYVRPDLPYNFYISCNFNNTFFESTKGRESFYRNEKRFRSRDEHFMENGFVLFEFSLGSISGNFKRKFPLWMESQNARASIRFDAGLWGHRYQAISGFLEIKKLVTVIKEDPITGEIKEFIEVGKASFEFEAEDSQGDKIIVTGGQYSLYGFK